MFRILVLDVSVRTQPSVLAQVTPVSGAALLGGAVGLFTLGPLGSVRRTALRPALWQLATSRALFVVRSASTGVLVSSKCNLGCFR